MSYTAIGGFADLWLYSDPDFRSRNRKRDARAGFVAYPCPTCGAAKGQPCTRATVAGPVPRTPHIGRGGPQIVAHNGPSMRGRYKRRGVG